MQTDTNLHYSKLYGYKHIYLLLLLSLIFQALHNYTYQTLLNVESKKTFNH